MPVAVLIGTFFILIAIGVPIAFAIGAGSLVYLAIYNPELTAIVPLRVWRS